MPSLSVSPSTLVQGELFGISWSGFADGPTAYLGGDLSATLGNTASGGVWGYVPTSWLGTYTVYAYQAVGGFPIRSNSVTFTVTAAAPPPPPPVEGKVYAITVQDKARNITFNYQNGVWDRQPEVTVGYNLYISACAVNQGGAGNLTLTIKDDTGAILASATVYMGTGAGFCIGTNTISMPDRAYGIVVAANPEYTVNLEVGSLKRR